MSNFDLTEKTQESIASAIQLAKDYANAQVHPVHLAFALLNEGAGVSGSLNGPSGVSLFTSVIQRAGGDPVCCLRSAIFQHYKLTLT
jgi:ATP-dependent Clp protease ATP-binding subunit ClpB